MPYCWSAWQKSSRDNDSGFINMINGVGLLTEPWQVFFRVVNITYGPRAQVTTL